MHAAGNLNAKLGHLEMQQNKFVIIFQFQVKEKTKVNRWTAGAEKQQSRSKWKRCEKCHRLTVDFSFQKKKRNAKIKPAFFFETIKILQHQLKVWVWDSQHHSNLHLNSIPWKSVSFFPSLICKFYSSNPQWPWPGHSAETTPTPHSFLGWMTLKENNKHCKMESFYFRKKQQITQVTFSKCNPNGNCTHIRDFRNERLTYLRTIYLEYTKKNTE